MLSREKIVNILQARKDYLKQKYGFNSISLFGSFAKNKATEASDIDIAVEVEDSFITLNNFMNAKRELSESLENKEIDLVYLDNLTVNPIIRSQIDKDSILIG